MKHLVILVILVFVSSSSVLSQDTIWTLQECINQSYKSNIQINQNVLDNEINKVNIAQAKSNLIPTLKANGGQNFNFGRSIDPTSNRYVNNNFASTNFSLGSNVTLFNGFKNINTIKQSTLLSKAGTYSIEQIKNEIAISITNSYLQILFNYENISNIEYQIELTTEQVERTKKLEKAGKVTESNLFQIQSQLASEQLSLVEAKNQLMFSKITLMQLMEIPVYDNFEIEKPIIKDFEEQNNKYKTSDEVYKIALESMPEIQKSELDYKSAELSYEIAKGDRLPTLSLSGGLSTAYSNTMYLTSYETYNTTEQIGYLQNNTAEIVLGNKTSTNIIQNEYTFSNQIIDNFSQYVGLNLSIPILNNRQAKSNIEKAKINIKSAELNKKETEKQLRVNVEQSYYDYIASKEKYKSSQEQLKYVELSYLNTVKKFDLGLINSVDLLIEKNNYINAKSSLLQAKYEYLFSIKVLSFYMGKPLDI